MKISAVVITKNEERRIERCLKALNFADEIIVLDSMSTDNTVEIAKKYTDKVSRREFTGFSDQKNAAVSMASGDWVLVVDADEVMTPELAEEIRKSIENSEYDAFKIPRLTCFIGKWIKSCGWYPDFQLRLVKKEKAHFPKRLIHETMVVDSRVGQLKNDLLHYSFEQLDDYTRKMVEYARMGAQQKFDEGRKFMLSDIFFGPSSTFMKMFFFKGGFKDGVHGFILSLLCAFSSLLRYSYLWELSSSKPKESGME